MDHLLSTILLTIILSSFALGVAILSSTFIMGLASGDIIPVLQSTLHSVTHLPTYSAKVHMLNDSVRFRIDGTASLSKQYNMFHVQYALTSNAVLAMSIFLIILYTILENKNCIIPLLTKIGFRFGSIFFVHFGTILCYFAGAKDLMRG